MTKDGYVLEMVAKGDMSLQEARERADYLERTYVFTDWEEATTRDLALDWADCRTVGMTDEEWQEVQYEALHARGAAEDQRFEQLVREEA